MQPNLPVAVLLLAAGVSVRASAQCLCPGAACSSVKVDVDNWTDLSCPRELIGRELLDSDADGLPDACDECPCVPNPPDPATGVIARCPEKRGGGSGATIRCEAGRVTGIPTHASVSLVRPATWAFTRFEAGSSHVLAGAHLLWARNLDSERCAAIDLGGVPTVRLTSAPRWYSRAALFVQAGSSLSELALDVALGLQGGIDYAPADSWWSLGPTLHVATLFPSLDPTPLLIGAGPRLGLLDAFSLTPFVQVDLLDGARPSLGAWIEVDWGLFEDLGLTRRKLLDAVGVGG